MSEVVIVGGPHDGQRHNVIVGASILVIPYSSPIPSGSLMPDLGRVDLERYVIEAIKTKDDYISFARHESLSISEALAKVFAGYGKNSR